MRRFGKVWWRLLPIGMTLLLATVSWADEPEAPTVPTQAPPKSDEAVLRERAQVYWQARVVQDLQKAYAFEDPLRQRKLGLVGYIRMVGEPGKLYDAGIGEIKIEGDQADVEVELTHRHDIPGWSKQVMKSTLTDDWQKIDEVWYHVVDLHLFRAGKPRVSMERGAIEYPPAPRVKPEKK